MICVFIQLRCRPGRTYEVADAIYDREFASELYSTSGEYDLLMKVYIPDGDGHRPLRQREDPRHPAHRPQPDDADLQGVLMIADWDDAYANAPAHPGRRRLSRRAGPAAAAAFRARSPRTGCGRRSPTGAHPRERIDLFLPEGAPARPRRLRPRRLLARASTAPTGRTSPPGRSPAAGRWRCPATCWRPRCGSPRSPAASPPPSPRRPPPSPGRCGWPATRPAATWSRARSAPTAAAAGGARRGIGRVVPISGLHDLRPLLRTALNDDAAARPGRGRGREPGAARSRSPGARVHAWVGAGERPEFVRQSALIANVWTGLGADMSLTVEPGRHHFDVIDALADPELAAGRGAGRGLTGAPHESAGAGGGDRRRRGRLLGALPSRPGRLDRRDADRALRADLGLVLARRRRLPHPERRPQRRQAPGLHRRRSTASSRSSPASPAACT